MLSENRFYYFLFGVLLSAQSHAFETYDQYLRVSSFEHEISFVGIEVDSTLYDYVYLGDEHLYSHVIFYIDKQTRAEVLLWSDNSCVYRQFFNEVEICLGRLEIDSNNFDLLEYDISDSLGIQSTTYFKNYSFFRTGSWRKCELINDVIIEEKQHYSKGLKHGVFEKNFFSLRLQSRVFDQGVLVSDSVYYSKNIQEADFFGTWSINKALNPQLDLNKSYYGRVYFLLKHDEFRSTYPIVTFQKNGSLSMIDFTSSCTASSENQEIRQGTWQWNASKGLVSISKQGRNWQIHFVTKDFIIFSEFD